MTWPIDNLCDFLQVKFKYFVAFQLEIITFNYTGSQKYIFTPVLQPDINNNNVAHIASCFTKCCSVQKHTVFIPSSKMTP